MQHCGYINLAFPQFLVFRMTKKNPHNTVITVDGTRGQVYLGVTKVL